VQASFLFIRESADRDRDSLLPPLHILYVPLDPSFFSLKNLIMEGFFLPLPPETSLGDTKQVPPFPFRCLLAGLLLGKNFGYSWLFRWAPLSPPFPPKSGVIKPLLAFSSERSDPLGVAPPRLRETLLPLAFFRDAFSLPRDKVLVVPSSPLLW